jgi:hypothetical protein
MSASALVVRLRQLRRFPHPFGIIACAQRGEEGFEIAAISRHPACRDVFWRAEQGAPISTLVSDPDFVLSGGSKSEVVIDAAGGKQFTVSCEDSNGDKRHSYFVTARREV